MGGSGGGGGSSGKSDWPDYMKGRHEVWLTTMSSYVDSSDNPYTASTAYSPSSRLTALESEFDLYTTLRNSLGANFAEFLDRYTSWFNQIKNSIINGTLADWENQYVARFEAGMRDINAVQTSAFALGRAMIYEKALLEVNKMGVQSALQGLSQTVQYIESRKAGFGIALDFSKVAMIAEKENIKEQQELDVSEQTWKYWKMREAGALLGAISGAAAQQSSPKPSPIQTALGMAMSGAAAGAMIGGHTGAVVGGVIGGVGGLISSIF